jgi:hypothetical protein
MILPLVVPEFDRLTLGALRNISLGMGTGNYVATWDDDDWSHPTRLAEQMQVIRTTGLPGCALSRLTLYDCETTRAYLSGKRPWENTLLVERSVLPPYPNIAKGEDTPVTERLVRHGRLALLDAPELYVYTYHGQNTWGRQHWERLVQFGSPLGVDASRQISLLVDAARPSGTKLPARKSRGRNQQIDEPLTGNRVWLSQGTSTYALTAGALHRTHNQSMRVIGD